MAVGIEAAQYQTPMIARNLPVFNEVAGNAAYYFDGFAPEDLSNAVLEWLAIYRSNQHPKSSDLYWQSWGASAKQLWDEIKKLKKNWH